MDISAIASIANTFKFRFFIQFSSLTDWICDFMISLNPNNKKYDFFQNGTFYVPFHILSN